LSASIVTRRPAVVVKTGSIQRTLTIIDTFTSRAAN
jgi:hypothetical protein